MIHNFYFDKLQQMASDFDRKGLKETAYTLRGAAFAIQEMALDIEASNRLLDGMGIKPGPNFPQRRPSCDNFLPAASAIEARSDATGTGAAEGESAVPQADAPKGSQ